MAITGRFVADFAGFYDAVTKAETSLRSFEGNANKVESSLNRMVDNFSGRKVITDATLMTDAITRAGGASTLTASEMAQVNAKLSEAIEKSKALGIEAPAAMQKLHAETTKVAPAMGSIPTGASSIMSAIGPLAGAFGIAFSASAVVGFGKALLDDADALVKLSDKTGIAIEPLQQLKYAAEQSGNTFEQVSGAVSMLQKRIGDGDESAVGALKKLGISVAAFKAMSPDEQFTAIAREVAKIEDPMERVTVATKLFGRSGAELLPTLIADITKLGDEAPVMSEKAVKAMDQVGDTFAREWTRVKNVAGESIGSLAASFGELGDSVSALVDGDFEKLARNVLGLAENDLPKLPPALDDITSSIQMVSMSAEKYDEISKALTATAEASIKTNKETIKHNEEVKRTQDALFGRDLIKKAEVYIEALGGVGNVTKLTSEKKTELTRTIDAALAAYKALGEQAPPEMKKLVVAAFDLDAEIKKLHEKSLPALTGLLTSIDRTLDPLPPHVAAFRSELRLTAETIETEVAPSIDTLTGAIGAFSEAMDLVRQGKGSMGGTFNNPYALNLSEGPAAWAKKANEMGGSVAYDDYGNPYIHVSGKNLPGKSGGGVAKFGSGGSGGMVANVTVNTVAGNGNEIARLVREAMVDFARGQGQRLPSRA